MLKMKYFAEYIGSSIDDDHCIYLTAATVRKEYVEDELLC